jgi:aminoglycoside phosphotransferase (APT) family kinase protein
VSEAPDLAPVRPGQELDWRGIDAFLRERVPGLAGEPSVLQFPNGAANLTYLLRYGERELVLRRPPFGTIAPGAHDMRREYKVLSRLWRSTRLAPRAYAFCEDKAVCGAEFFVMERRHGVVVRNVIPSAMRHHERVGRRLGFAIVDAMAELHALDASACELGDLGKPDGFAARQVAGWRRRWELSRPAGVGTLMDELGERLAARVPSPARTSIVHNDLKPDNCQFDPADPDQVKSIFDWDMTTLGDPLIDLGTLVQYWPDAGDPSFRELASNSGLAELGLPSRAEIAARYGERTQTPLAPLRWWIGFAYWKTAVVTQQLYNRFAKGEGGDARMAAMADRAPRLAARADRELRDAGI